jgi:hypothetical protein
MGRRWKGQEMATTGKKSGSSAIGQALVALRWAKRSPEERSEQAKRSAKTMYKGTTKEERSAMMRALVMKRWSKKSRARRTGGGR